MLRYQLLDVDRRHRGKYGEWIDSTDIESATISVTDYQLSIVAEIGSIDAKTLFSRGDFCSRFSSRSDVEVTRLGIEVNYFLKNLRMECVVLCVVARPLVWVMEEETTFLNQAKYNSIGVPRLCWCIDVVVIIVCHVVFLSEYQCC